MKQESPFIQSLLAADPELFDRSIETLCGERGLPEILKACEELEVLWRGTENLYLRVRALEFLYYLHRFVLPKLVGEGVPEGVDLPDSALDPCPIPINAHRALQSRNFTEAIEVLLGEGLRARVNETLSSGLANAYYALAMQNLANQVRVSVRQEVGNQWMFRIGHPDDFPLRIRPEMLAEHGMDGTFPWLVEQTPVRMDLSHSSWSDIFFLGMDRPEFAKVINVSINLAISGSPTGPVPPCLSAIRVIDRPVFRLVSIDLECQAEVTDLPSMFDFGHDYLGLLKAALIAAGIIPPGMEGSRTSLDRLLGRLLGPGKGLELVSWVRDIPKGSRLAVSTNLLGSMIATCMRATGQVRSIKGPLSEEERRIVASRAILGEWLGGSGGGWQDSGGAWPGVKLIEGCTSDGLIANSFLSTPDHKPSTTKQNPETSPARGALLPRHTRLDGQLIPTSSIDALEASLVLIHGGMAANVGPILEMVTERYLLRSEVEWEARQASLSCTREILEVLRKGDVRELGRLTTGHFFGPLKTIIPWASNAFTERLISEVSRKVGATFGKPGEAGEPVGAAVLGSAFWGFWMLGGMSGGGMGLIFRPDILEQVKPMLSEILLRLKKEYEHSLPFAMDPVIYDFRINAVGTSASVVCASVGREVAPVGSTEEAFLKEYLRFQLPGLLQKQPSRRTRQENRDLQRIHALSGQFAGAFLAGLLPEDSGPDGSSNGSQSLDTLLSRYGFDLVQHEQIRDDLQTGRVGLSQNRLNPKTLVEDVDRAALQLRIDTAACRERGETAIRDGECLVLTLAAGAGSRWTQGAGVVKALHPFAPFDGVFRNFLELHMAKTCLSARSQDTRIPHVVTTSYLTHAPIHSWAVNFAERFPGIAGNVDLRLSEGRSVGLRLVPTCRDLHYAWFVLPQEKLDEQAEKLRDSVRQALMRWARESGEASDYRDNLPSQCLHPVGHWYELPNLLLNGTLHQLLVTYPQLTTILLHNIDTLGASLDPILLGHHLLAGVPLTCEVIQRRFDDVGGGLARVNGIRRLVEGFALPRDEDEFRLSFYNTLTNWIDLESFLSLFNLTRKDVLDRDCLPGGSRYPRLQKAVREVAAKMPTYITLKESKKRWGRGQEDIFPVLQFERLWGDMPAYLASQGLPGADFLEVSRSRGQQLKDPAQLDAWSREGSREALEKALRPVFSGERRPNVSNCESHDQGA